jgi:hypothetical protein
LELTLNVFEEEDLEEIIEKENIEIVSEINIDTLPVSEVYGNPRSM